MKKKNFSFRYVWLELMSHFTENEQMEIIQVIAHFGRCGKIMEQNYNPLIKHIVTKPTASVAAVPMQTDKPVAGFGRDPTDPGATYRTAASQSKITWYTCSRTECDDSTRSCRPPRIDTSVTFLPS